MSPARSDASAKPLRRKVGRPVQGDSDETRRLVLDAAISEFGSRGLARTTLRDVAQAAGLTAGTVYHHFSSKTDLYIAAYAEAVERVYAIAEKAIAGREALLDRLEAVLDCFVETGPGTMHVPFSFILRAWVEHSEPGALPLPVPPIVLTFLNRITDDAVLRGEIRRADALEFIEVYRTMAWGLSALSLTGHEHAQGAVVGLKRLLAGRLLSPPRERLGAVRAQRAAGKQAAVKRQPSVAGVAKRVPVAKAAGRRATSAR
jgi:AcrR family transcriptional regulator